jgi:hypothetical protein
MLTLLGGWPCCNVLYSTVTVKGDRPAGMSIFVITTANKLTGTCQPFSIGAELDRRHSFGMSCKCKLQCVVWFLKDTQTHLTPGLSLFFLHFPFCAL